MKVNKIYYKIKNNSCDEWEIVSTTNRECSKHEALYSSFGEAKKELIEVLRLAMIAEREAMWMVQDLKLKDIKTENTND